MAPREGRRVGHEQCLCGNFTMMHIEATMKKAAGCEYDEVLRLAHEIEKRLEPPAPQGELTGHDAYGLRLAQALTRSLIDQLDELRKFHAA